jgi:methylglutaconyl-CoA hydratase
VGGGVGLAAACDYTFATKHASIRLSELAVGIGPFVIGPAVVRKIGLSAFTQMSLTPHDWQTAEWSKEKGLYFETFEDIESMDNRIEKFTSDLLSFHTDALQNLKKIFWQDTSHWDALLPERAAISGKLILKDFSQSLIHKFKHQ